MTPERWRQITGIFQDALAHETGQRDAFVDGACGDDHALAGLHANVRVSLDFSSDPAGVFTWEGRYHFVR